MPPTADDGGELASVIKPLLVDAVMDTEVAQLAGMTRGDAREIVNKQWARITSAGYALVKVVI